MYVTFETCEKYLCFSLYLLAFSLNFYELTMKDHRRLFHLRVFMSVFTLNFGYVLK